MTKPIASAGHQQVNSPKPKRSTPQGDREYRDTIRRRPSFSTVHVQLEKIAKSNTFGVVRSSLEIGDSNSGGSLAPNAYSTFKNENSVSC